MGKLPSVPMPTPDYGQSGGHVRDKLVQMYGETSVLRAEIAICIQLLMMNGIIRPSQFVDLLQEILRKTEERRREAAGFRD